MIIFYNKKNNSIIGTIEGRVHTPEQEKVMIIPDGLTPEDVGVYKVPFKENFKTVIEDIKENRVVNKRTMRVEEVIVGTRKVKKPTDMSPDVSYSKIISDIEEGKDRIHNYKVSLNDKGEVVNLVKNKLR